MAENKNFVLMGIISILCFSIPWLIFAFIHWSTEGFSITDNSDMQFLVSLITSALAIGTSFHLWSRVPKLEGRLKKLFFLTGFTFIALLAIFIFVLVNTTLEWQGLLTITQAINRTIPTIQFYFFGIESLKATMPADSFITFALILFAISFYLFPIEKYVKQKVPWHTISMFICTALLPILVLFVPRNFVAADIVMSIVTTVIVTLVFYNFLFLFYLYFSTGMKSPKGTPLRKASFMIGIGLLLFIFTWIVSWAVTTGTPLIDLGVQMTFGGIAMFLFNYGYYLIRVE